MADPDRVQPESVAALSPSSHLAHTAKLAAGRWRLLLYSLANKPLPSGDVALLKINVPTTAPLGAVHVTPTNAIVVHPQGASLQPLDLAPGQIQISFASAARWISVRRETNGFVTLAAQATSGQTYEIQATSDLVSWTTLVSLTATNHAIEFVDVSAAALASRYYRARSAP